MAIVVMQVNMGEACVCAGRVDASFGTFRYHEAGSGRDEEIPPFPPSAGNALPVVRVMQFPRLNLSSSLSGHFRPLPAPTMNSTCRCRCRRTANVPVIPLWSF
jgi:hypothetical protein